MVNSYIMIFFSQMNSFASRVKTIVFSMYKSKTICVKVKVIKDNIFRMYLSTIHIKYIKTIKFLDSTHYILIVDKYILKILYLMTLTITQIVFYLYILNTIVLTLEAKLFI